MSIYHIGLAVDHFVTHLVEVDVEGLAVVTLADVELLQQSIVAGAVLTISAKSSRASFCE